jgi:hypothetical protein
VYAGALEIWKGRFTTERELMGRLFLAVIVLAMLGAMVLIAVLVLPR